MADNPTISEPVVMSSAAGYYIGCYCTEDFFGKEVKMPYDRYSGYFETKEEAEESLPDYL